MNELVRLKAQRALRCFASALAQKDTKAYAEKRGWTPTELHALIDSMYDPSLSIEEGLED